MHNLQVQAKDTSKATLKSSITKERHAPLKRYQQRVLGVNPDQNTNDIGKLFTNEIVSTDPVSSHHENLSSSTDSIGRGSTHDVYINELSEIERESLRQAEDDISCETQKFGLPTVSELLSKGFGKPSKDHSFTQEASFETVVFQVLKVGSGYLDDTDRLNLRLAHPLLSHLDKMIIAYKSVDFSKLREYNLDYASQQEIPRDRVQMFMACLFHYDLSVANVMRYIGNNYTGGYRTVEQMVDRMRGLVDDDLLTQYIRVMTVGAPAHFNAETSRENAMLHWREGNHKSISQNLDKIEKAMNKLEKHNFVIPLNSWIARFIPHIFFTPQHFLQRKGKDPRLIYDASRRFTPTSIPVNRMTSTHRGVELDCEYGQVFTRLLIRIWNLRITYPDTDIVLHANDVKSCFRQMKHHPDVMGAFSYIIADVLYLSCGLTFGSDFSPQTWEVPRRICEQLATSLFQDETLVEKHRDRLNQLTWSKKLGKASKEDFTPAHATTTHTGVLDSSNNPVNTPHHMFVDDDVYAEVFDVNRIERAIASGIEAVFMILGESDLSKRQDPISWDKLLEMMIHFKNIILGHLIDTRQMTVQTPPEYISKVVLLLETSWMKGKRFSFEIKQAENLTGQLGHISNTTLWLKHLLSHLYTSIAAALKSNKSYLICTNSQFRAQIKIAKEEASDEVGEMKKTFAQAETARKVHNFKKKHFILPTMHDELYIIRTALSSDDINNASPIAHLIPGIKDAEAHGDSSLDSAGGWSVDMKFWWWIDWPLYIRQRTLKYIKDGKSGKLIDINALEYATVIINYAASMHFWITQRNCEAKNIPYPRVLIMADNKSSESWATKGCKRSLIGRRLGRLQCTMMMNNPVGLDTGHVDTKANIIADKISRWKSQTDTLLGFDVLKQEFKQLKSCQRFHPSKELISLVLDALSSDKLINPLEVRELLLKYPGSLAS